MPEVRPEYCQMIAEVQTESKRLIANSLEIYMQIAEITYRLERLKRRSEELSKMASP